MAVLVAVLGAAVVTAGCSTGSTADETVTLTQRVGDPTARTPRSTPVTRPPTSPRSSDGSSAGQSSSTVPTDRSKTRTTGTTAGPSRSTVGPDGHPAQNAPAVPRDTAGPDTGAPCATDAQYVDEQPTGLRSDVVAGWRAIEKAANTDGVIVCLNDGKRSTEQQQVQYDQYVEQYGAEAANQLVLPPNKSAHVTGNAIDVQPQPAYQWLQATKGRLGFCRIYDNEPWHFEYDVAYFKGCPARLPKPER